MGNDRPRTIGELGAFAERHNLPLDQMRFFIGQDIREAKAFGIYRDPSTGNFVVYKNKADGTRSVRYEGPDEAFAVSELYERMRHEVAARHATGKTTRAAERAASAGAAAPSMRRQAAGDAPVAARRASAASGALGALRRLAIPLVSLLVAMSLVSSCVATCGTAQLRGGSKAIRRGYYKAPASQELVDDGYDDQWWYYLGDDWYYWDYYEDAWLPGYPYGEWYDDGAWGDCWYGDEWDQSWVDGYGEGYWAGDGSYSPMTDFEGTEWYGDYLEHLSSSDYGSSGSSGSSSWDYDDDDDDDWSWDWDDDSDWDWDDDWSWSSDDTDWDSDW